MNEPNSISQSMDVLELREFFLIHLNKIYCAKSHLGERLPEIADQAGYRDLKNAILETLEDVVKQISRIEEIFVMLDSIPSLDGSDFLVNLVEDGFNSIHGYENTKKRDLSILFYLMLIESIEISSFKILMIAASEMPDVGVRQLLKENFDESKADKELLLLITSKYMN